MKKRALLSVSDKSGILEFAKVLEGLGYELLSTGGTMKHLADNGVAVTAVDAVTGFPEIMEGRVKTLNPMIHGPSELYRSRSVFCIVVRTLFI